MRTLHLHDRPFDSGPDVTSLQHLLNAKGFACAVDGVFGPDTATVCVKAKKALHYPKAEQLPVAGQRLVLKLRALPDRKPKPPNAKLAKRAAVVAYWRWGIEHEPQIHYAQIRPFPVNKLKTLPMRTDCSGFYSLGLKAAGLPDPNGLKWTGLGYTGTLLQHGRKVTKAMARPGDAVVFGPYPGHHVCGVLEAGSDPLLMSHGQEAGPIPIRLSEEQKFQPYPATFIDYIGG